MKLKTIRRTYLQEAAVMLILARLAVRFVPPARLFAWANRPHRRINRFAHEEVSWVAWAIEYLGERSWMNTLCLPRAFATHAMLRRRGIVSRVCLGVAGRSGIITAHAWVEVGKDKIVATAEAKEITRLAEFGGS